MQFTDLTPHQLSRYNEILPADFALLLAPAGGGKTFVAIQRMVDVLQDGQDMLFASRNLPLVLFVVNWLVHACKKDPENVVGHVQVMFDGSYGNFSDGPR